MKFNELSFEVLRDNFLLGKYSGNLDEHSLATSALHNNLPAIEDLLPLISSKDRYCQYTAVYIAALEGESASSIFPYVFELLKSPWVEVRDEVCDCFAECATEAHQLVELFEHLEDPEESIRLKVMSVLFCLKNAQIDLVFKHTQCKPELDKLSLGISLLYKQKEEGLSIECLKVNAKGGTRITKLFTYAAAIKELDNIDGLYEIAQLSADHDIFKHYEIYYNDDE
jgi:hypothetical protein